MKKTFTRTILFLLAAIMIMSVMPVAAFAAEGDDDANAEEIVYHVRPVHDGNGYFSADNCNTAESEHFQMLWGDKNTSFVTEQFIENNLTLFEACWDLYIGDLGMSPPSLCTWERGDQETHYKVNIVVWGTGLAGYGSDPNEWAAYGGVDADGYAYMMCSRDAMQLNSAALPHEFGHATHFAQGFNSWADGTYLGPWYEAIGNWYREQYYYSEYDTSGTKRTDFSPLILRAASLTAANGRAYYEAWPILQYMTENPDDLPGYGPNFVSKLLQNGSPSGYIYNMISEQAEASLEETLGYFAAHMATMDFAEQARYQSNVKSCSGWFFWQQFYTMLEKVPNAENTYVTPTERAPQQAAYVVTPLTITGDEISVTLKGLSTADGAAWRACIVTVSGDDTHYSELFGNGETMKVSASGVDEAYLTVAATPRLDTYVKDSVFMDETKNPFSDMPRYPYEAVITGAVPSEREISGGGTAHPNGGGLVARSAKVDESVYVGPDAMVLGNARVSGNARIEGHAVVMGNAHVSGNAVIDGYAVIAESATVKDDAHVGDFAIVLGSAKVTGNGQVIQSAYVAGTYTVKDNAIAKGLSLCLGSGKLTDQGIADGDYFDDGSVSVSAGTATGYFPAFGNDTEKQRYVKNLRSTEGMFMSYTFSSADSDYIANEQYGSTYAIVNGAKWDAGSSDTAQGIYTFGKDAYMILDSMAASTKELQVQLKMKLDGGEGNILSFEGANGSIALTVNSDGIATLTIKSGEEEITATAVKAIPAGEWTDVTVTFADGKAILTVGGENIAVAECTITPADIRADYGILGGGFEGAVDSMKFFFNNAAKVDTTSASISAPGNGDNNGDNGDNAETGSTDKTPADTDKGSSEEKSGCGSAIGNLYGIVLVIAAGAFVCRKKTH